MMRSRPSSSTRLRPDSCCSRMHGRCIGNEAALGVQLGSDQCGLPAAGQQLLQCATAGSPGWCLTLQQKAAIRKGNFDSDCLDRGTRIRPPRLCRRRPAPDPALARRTSRTQPAGRLHLEGAGGCCTAAAGGSVAAGTAVAGGTAAAASETSALADVPSETLRRRDAGT